MGSRRKAALREILKKRDRQGLVEWSRTVRAPLRALFSLTYSPDELLRWRAIEAVGVSARYVASESLEKVRVFLRGMLWLMNDESGGIGWSAPEVIAEVLFHCPSLIGEFGDLLPHFLVEEPFEPGTHYALYRLRRVAPGLILSSVSRLEQSLRDPDPAVRGYAWLSLRHVGSEIAFSSLEQLKRDRGEFTSYDFTTGELRVFELAEIAEQKEEEHPIA